MLFCEKVKTKGIEKSIPLDYLSERGTSEYPYQRYGFSQLR